MHTGDNGREPKISEFRACGYQTMETLMSFPTDGNPVMMLEYGHAMGNSPGLMKDTWDYVYRNRHICGGYVWSSRTTDFTVRTPTETSFTSTVEIFRVKSTIGLISLWTVTVPLTVLQRLHSKNVKTSLRLPMFPTRMER